MSSATEIVEAGRELVAAATADGIALRLLGGAGIILHCPRTMGGTPHREIGDLDVVVDREGGRWVSGVFEALGYKPDRRFNAMQGDRRMIFEGPIGKVDLFVDRFEMCHRLELAPRLGLEPVTITSSDLLLTKLQIRELTEKDVQDIVALLVEHETERGPGDHIDLDYLGGIVRDDWGWWRSATGTLQDVGVRQPEIAARAREIEAALDAAPKSRPFRIRARVGERKRWYQLPDEIE